MKVLSGKGRGAQVLTGKRKEEEKASARECAVMWNFAVFLECPIIYNRSIKC